MKHILRLLFFILLTAPAACQAGFSRQSTHNHAHIITGGATALCAANLARTSYRSLRTVGSLPLRSKSFWLQALVVPVGIYITKRLTTKNPRDLIAVNSQASSKEENKQSQQQKDAIGKAPQPLVIVHPVQEQQPQQQNVVPQTAQPPVVTLQSMLEEFSQSRVTDAAKYPLHYAIMFRDAETVRALLQFSEIQERVNVLDRHYGRTPLHAAVDTRSLEMVKLLLQEAKELNVNKKNRSDNTPLRDIYLYTKIPDVKIDIAAELLADPRIDKKEGMEYLFEALRFGHWRLIEKMPSAWTTERNENGNTLLHQALRNQLVDRLPSEVLSKIFPLNVNIQNNDGNTVLHLAVTYFSRSIATVKLALEHKEAIITTPNKKGQSALHIAATENSSHTTVIPLLLDAYKERKLDVNAQDNEGNTPLHCACKENRDENIQLLLAHSGINVNAQNNNGDTPLLIACRNQNIKGIKLLLSAGASPLIENNKGESMASILKYHKGWLCLNRSEFDWKAESSLDFHKPKHAAAFNNTVGQNLTSLPAAILETILQYSGTQEIVADKAATVGAQKPDPVVAQPASQREPASSVPGLDS